MKIQQLIQLVVSFKEFFTQNSCTTEEQAYNYIKNNVKTTDFQNKVKEYVNSKSLQAVDTLTGVESN